MTFLRNMGLAHKLPLDHSIYFHKVVGWLIFSQAWLHTISHLINFGKLFISKQLLYFTQDWCIIRKLGWVNKKKDLHDNIKEHIYKEETCIYLLKSTKQKLHKIFLKPCPHLFIYIDAAAPMPGMVWYRSRVLWNH